jgi:hypothetical protein
MNNRLFPPINKSQLKNVTAQINGPYHVFDGGGGYYVSEERPGVLAEGAVVKAQGLNVWYVIHAGRWQEIKRKDIPAEVRATMLILSLNL